jgi:hypothetical protein
MLFIDIAVGDTLRIGEVEVTLTRKSGKKAQLRVDADPAIIVRHQLRDIPDKNLTLPRAR